MERLNEERYKFHYLVKNQVGNEYDDLTIETNVSLVPGVFDAPHILQYA